MADCMLPKKLNSLFHINVGTVKTLGIKIAITSTEILDINHGQAFSNSANHHLKAPMAIRTKAID